MSSLSVLILCGRSPRHLYLANRLCEVAHPVAIVNEVGSEGQLRKTFHLLKKPRLLWRKIWRWTRDRRRYTGDREAKYFFGTGTAQLDRPDLLVEVPHINDFRIPELVEQHQPDIIAVFGTSLIRGELLEKGRLGMINLHGGLSPHYRGADCTFWALYNQEPEKIGCSLHYIDAGIDTGGLIAHVCPPITGDEDELSLFWGAVKESAGVYAELFERIEAGERFGRQQQEKGHLYQVKDRLLRHEKKVDQLISDGLLLRSKLPARVEWFSCGLRDQSVMRDL